IIIMMQFVGYGLIFLMLNIVWSKIKYYLF
ncbi:unnamed protein product, partial [marine sediment metagenome]